MDRLRQQAIAKAKKSEKKIAVAAAAALKRIAKEVRACLPPLLVYIHAHAYMHIHTCNVYVHTCARQCVFRRLTPWLRDVRRIIL